MKIGDRCFVHGYVDEIRKDTVIIRNSGGYFGTDPSEVTAAFDTERTGKWIRISPAKIYECSICGKNVMTADIDEYHFCHGCGARMEETT